MFAVAYRANWLPVQDVAVRERLTGEVVKMFTPPKGGTVIYIEFRLEQNGELLHLSSRLPPEDYFARGARVRFSVCWQRRRTSGGQWGWDQVSTAVVSA